MLKYYAATKLYFEIGSQIGFLTEANLVTKANGQSFTQDSKSIFKDIDFSGNFGLGFDFTKDFFVNFRYSLGLSNIAKTTSGDDTKISNSVISFGLGYKFR